MQKPLNNRTVIAIQSGFKNIRKANLLPEATRKENLQVQAEEKWQKIKFKRAIDVRGRN